MAVKSQLQKFQWHPQIHEVAGEESLHYWFLSFASNFEWERLQGVLKQLIDEHGVISYALYELMGDYDMLLRVWLPSGTAAKFGSSLQERLAVFSLARAERYNVESVIRHWPFAPRGVGAIKELSDGEALPPNGRIQEVNELLAQVKPHDDKLLATSLRKRLIGPPVKNRDEEPGVKIVTLIKPVRGLTPDTKRGLGNQVARVLDEQRHIRQRSLYQVEGWDAAFLLTCLAPEDKFFAFRESLIRDLSPLLEATGARTNSYSCASRDLVMFQDRVAAPDHQQNGTLPEPEIPELLSLEESATLEVKGSAFTPLDPWLLNGEGLAESARFFQRGVLRAIVAFLNGEGGTVVIGALEPGRYEKRLHDERLSNFPRIGAYLCPGLLDPTFEEKGWDAYERKIGESIAKNVSPAPSGLRIRKERFEGIDFCVIDVPSGRREDWHYLESPKAPSQFLVRQGARIVELNGIEADRYKKKIRSSQ
jgi:hypothetical protein